MSDVAGHRLHRRLAHDQRVLDADTAAVGQIDTGLHGHRGASKQCTGGRRADSRRFVDLQSDTVPEAVAEVLGVPGVGDHLPRLRRPHRAAQPPAPAASRPARWAAATRS